jgi:hypothetical protein
MAQLEKRAAGAGHHARNAKGRCKKGQGENSKTFNEEVPPQADNKKTGSNYESQIDQEREARSIR